MAKLGRVATLAIDQHLQARSINDANGVQLLPAPSAFIETLPRHHLSELQIKRALLTVNNRRLAIFV